MNGNATPRNWKEIARELASEQNPSRRFELSRELNQAMTEEERKGCASWRAKDEFEDRESA